MNFARIRSRQSDKNAGDGIKDFRVPVNQTIAARSYVQRMQVPGTLLVFHDANHWIMKGEEARDYWQEVHGWLAKYLQEDD